MTATQGTRTLRDAVNSVRSKNAGPFTVTFDLFFPDRETFKDICDRKVDMIISGAVNVYPAGGTGFTPASVIWLARAFRPITRCQHRQVRQLLCRQPTSRAPASRISWRMLAYDGDSTATRSPRPAKR